MTTRTPTRDAGPTRTTAERDDQAVAAAVTAVGAGRAVVVTDDTDRENEGDLIFAAEHATPELMALLVRHSSGVVCVPMTGADLDRLQIPLMVADNRDSMRTAFTVTVDAATGVGTGISAADRARTVRVLADPQTLPSDLNRPGHLFPLRAQDGGVLQRRGHTEAAVDLARSAGLSPAAVISELVNDDGTMMRGPQLYRFAEQHGLPVISIEQLAGYRRRQQQLVERVAETALPTAYGTFTAHGYRSRLTGIEHVALVAGSWRDASGPPLVRVHSECLTGDAFGSLRCDCGPQLHDAMAQIAGSGGILIYLRGQEGRGIGLTPKLRAYQLQEAGRDTVDANLDLGLPADARDYAAAAQILRDLGADSVRLLSNNPDKVDGLSRAGIEVQQVPTAVFSNPHNLDYLRAKRDRMGHHVAGLGGSPEDDQPTEEDQPPEDDRAPEEAAAMTGEHR